MVTILGLVFTASFAEAAIWPPEPPPPQVITKEVIKPVVIAFPAAKITWRGQ